MEDPYWKYPETPFQKGQEVVIGKCFFGGTGKKAEVVSVYLPPYRYEVRFMDDESQQRVCEGYRYDHGSLIGTPTGNHRDAIDIERSDFKGSNPMCFDGATEESIARHQLAVIKKLFRAEAKRINNDFLRRYLMAVSKGLISP